MKKIKIQPKYRKRTYDETVIPAIRIEGKWLEALGFQLGGYVQVEWQEKKLVITPCEYE